MSSEIEGVKQAVAGLVDLTRNLVSWWEGGAKCIGLQRLCTWHHLARRTVCTLCTLCTPLDIAPVYYYYQKGLQRATAAAAQQLYPIYKSAQTLPVLPHLPQELPISYAVSTFTEGGKHCCTSLAEFAEPEAALEYVQGIKLCQPPEEPHLSMNGDDVAENTKVGRPCGLTSSTCTA